MKLFDGSYTYLNGFIIDIDTDRSTQNIMQLIEDENLEFFGTVREIKEEDLMAHLEAFKEHIQNSKDKLDDYIKSYSTLEELNELADVDAIFKNLVSTLKDYPEFVVEVFLEKITETLISLVDVNFVA